MRFLNSLKNDIKYQLKYGLYILYIFITIICILLVWFVPEKYKQTVTAIAVLLEASTLGMFFIGGMWLLEKGEGIHKYLVISPIRSIEYVLSKAISLAIISVLAGVGIIYFGLKGTIDYINLIVYMLIGSMIFTMIGMFIASYAQSVNQYILFVTPISTVLMVPPLITILGINNLIFDLLPSVALIKGISNHIGIDMAINNIWLVFAFWITISLILTVKRISIALEL